MVITSDVKKMRPQVIAPLLLVRSGRSEKRPTMVISLVNTAVAHCYYRSDLRAASNCMRR
jgi:hypothetical protein